MEELGCTPGYIQNKIGDKGLKHKKNFLVKFLN